MCLELCFFLTRPGIYSVKQAPEPQVLPVQFGKTSHAVFNIQRKILRMKRQTTFSISEQPHSILFIIGFLPLGLQPETQCP